MIHLHRRVSPGRIIDVSVREHTDNASTDLGFLAAKLHVSAQNYAISEQVTAWIRITRVLKKMTVAQSDKEILLLPELKASLQMGRSLKLVLVLSPNTAITHIICIDFDAVVPHISSYLSDLEFSFQFLRWISNALILSTIGVTCLENFPNVVLLRERKKFRKSFSWIQYINRYFKHHTFEFIIYF
jgi:hypothetical protein